MPYYTAVYAEMKGVGLVLLATTGYTGSGGFEVYVPNPMAEKAWHAIMAAGEPFGIKPTGLAARDTLRLEMGFCLYGNDLSDTTSPLEAGLGWITKFVEGKNFISRALLRLGLSLVPRSRSGKGTSSDRACGRSQIAY